MLEQLDDAPTIQPVKIDPRLAALHKLRKAVAARAWHLQDDLIKLLGSSPDDRSRLVSAALARAPNEAASYWLQLVVAIGIASLGLVVGSAAVIIGAMLVAPLMGPIVTLALGLAAGSPFLVLRSAARILASVAAAIGGAAAITVLLPFHETNAEIMARTSPTVLDLLTAAFCALAGVYASLRPGSDTAATAAGTSIGISLVPPLCASGYGLGTGLWSVCGGAALLFLTNLVAILVVGTIAFVAAGFNRVDVTSSERAELAKSQGDLVTAAIARRLAGLFESRSGPALRFVMPFALLGAVYIPLGRALDEVAWEVGARAAVQKALEAEKLPMVHSRVHVERHSLELQLVMLGTTADAEALQARLTRTLRDVAQVEPRLNVLAIPDAASFAGLESSMRTPHEPIQIPPPPPPPSPSEQLEVGRAFARTSVERLWPEKAAGVPLEIELSTQVDAPTLRVRVTHLGHALGPDSLEGLEKSLAATLTRPVRLIDAAIPDQPLTRELGDLLLVSAVSDAVHMSQLLDAVQVCATEPQPAQDKRRRRDPNDETLSSALHAVLARHPRVAFVPGEAWSVQFQRGPCSPPLEAAGDSDPQP